MTKQIALKRIRKWVATHGGKPEHVSIRERVCRAWSADDPKNRRRKPCDSLDHGLDCPVGVSVCSVLYLKLVNSGYIGTIGFNEIVASEVDWATAVAKVEERTYWV